MQRLFYGHCQGHKTDFMKKGFLIPLLVSTFLLTIFACSKDSKQDEPYCIELPTSCFKGRLEIKDICGNYTVKVLEGNIDPSLIEASWEHPTTKTVYTNVFSLGNICAFPSTINEGDTFYFTIRTNKKERTCAQCLAYAPTPNKILSINVYTTPCTTSSN